MTNAAQWIGMAASGLAAICFLYATFIAVPDNIDTIVGEMQRVGRWNAAARITVSPWRAPGILCADNSAAVT
jgi:hypothetical protein